MRFEVVTTDVCLKNKIEISMQKAAALTVKNHMSSQLPHERPNIQTELTRHGRKITYVKKGSIIFSIMCPTLEALDDLYNLYTSGQLTDLATDAYITDICPEGTTINVTIDESAWNRCRAQLLSIGGCLFDKVTGLFSICKVLLFVLCILFNF